MAGNLWSCDATAEKIYQHSGGTSTVSTSFASPSTTPYGLTWDGTNLWSCDSGGVKIYRHSGGTSTISTSFAGPESSVNGLAWDGTNLWSCDSATKKIYQHSGGTSTISTSFASPETSASYGLTWDGTNLWSCCTTTDKIYRHSGGTSTISTSFASPDGGPVGLAWDGTNLWSGDYVDKIYQHSGGTSTISTSFATPAGQFSGLTWQEIVIVAPTVTTQAATNILVTLATGNGNITDDGGASITQHGVCWKKGADPVNIGGADGYTQEGAGAEGAFTSTITPLIEQTLYYYRAYATNSEGTSYGGAQSFTTLRQPRHGFINFQDPGIL